MPILFGIKLDEKLNFMYNTSIYKVSNRGIYVPYRFYLYEIILLGNFSMETNEKPIKSNQNDESMKFFKEENFPKGENYFADAFKDQLPRQIIFIALIVLIAIFIFVRINLIIDFIKAVISILSPIILGWVLTFIMAPLYDTLKNKFLNSKNVTLKKFSGAMATFVSALVVIGVMVGLIFLFVPQLYTSVTSFIGNSDNYITNVRGIIRDLTANSGNHITNQILSQVESAINGILVNSSNFDISKFVTGIYNGFYLSLKAVINIFIAFVVMIYSLNMKEELCYGLKRMLFAIVRKDHAKKILVEVRYAKLVFSNFFFGKILDSFIIGVLCYICCLIMGMPYTPLISVIVGLTNIIPFFGPFIGAIPSFLLILLENPFSWRPYGFLVFILVLQQIDGNIIGPKILGDKTGVGSFWVLFSILLFGGLFGFVGMVVAVPLWAIITRLTDEFIVMRLKKKGYPLSTDEYLRLKEYNATLNNVEDKG